MSTSAIQFADVGLSLGGDPICENLSFEVKQGEFVCLLGPSGCGKSTSLRLMGDLLDLQRGTIIVDGEAPAAAWSRLAYVFQTPRLLPWKNALDNAAFGLEMRHPEIKPEERRSIAAWQLARVGLAAEAEKMPHMLSGGERQRVAIARALVLDPQIILMDEPFSALDPNTRQRLRREIVEIWAESKKTIVFVTHDIDEALYLADRIVLLSLKPTSVRLTMEVAASRPRDTEHDPQLRAARSQLLTIFDEMGAIQKQGEN